MRSEGSSVSRRLTPSPQLIKNARASIIPSGQAGMSSRAQSASSALLSISVSYILRRRNAPPWLRTHHVLSSLRPQALIRVLYCRISLASAFALRCASTDPRSSLSPNPIGLYCFGVLILRATFCPHFGDSSSEGLYHVRSSERINAETLPTSC
jgi:hypothetical protein